MTVVAAGVGAGMHAEEGPHSPLRIGDRNQVFVDGRFVAAARGSRIVACQPRKTYERCLVGGLRGYETILPVDGVFRGFHALSKDGTHWRRVEPGTAPEADDVVGLFNGDPHPFVDPQAPPEERYKLFTASAVKASADGAHWRTVAERMFPPEAYFPRGMDSLNKCFFDTRLGKYVAYVRVNEGHPAPPERQAYFNPISKRNYGREGMYLMRAIGRAVSDDLFHFPMPQVVFRFDAHDPHFGGVGVLDFYTPEVNLYEHAQDAYFLFPGRYLHYEEWFLGDDLSKHGHHSTGQLNSGPVDIGFAASRDGIHWYRYERKPWIVLGPEGSFDAKSMYMCAGMVSHGTEIWMYYVGYPTLHGGPEPAGERVPTLSRVVLQRDRFTAVEAAHEGGEFTTPSLVFDGCELRLNLETSALGMARVEIQDASGVPVDGYAMEDCDRIHTANTVDRCVTWRRGHRDLAHLAGKSVRLRFHLQFGARLFAFRFSKED